MFNRKRVQIFETKERDKFIDIFRIKFSNFLLFWSMIIGPINMPMFGAPRGAHLTAG